MRGLAGAQLATIRGGLSNHAWRADLGGRSYFVRLGGPDAASLGVDRKSECVLLEAAAAAGLSPGVLACDPGNGLLVTDFVRGDPWRREDVHEPRNLARIGAVLRALHRLPLHAGVRRISFQSQAKQLEVQLAAFEAVDPALRRVADCAFEALSARRDCVTLCHNDLHHLNVLDDGDRLWVVDWEYGGCGDPLFDLASFLCQHESTPAERDALLDAYGSTSGTDASRVVAACIAFDYVQWLWYRLWVARRHGATGEYATRGSAIACRLRAVRV
jgi:aminoglycoside phosphotransferase (APT) family kinase protein